MPLPLKVVRYYVSSDMAQISGDILGLSKMNWNSFNLYSKLPCTIESSNEIARIGWLLSQYERALYDYRYFMQLTARLLNQTRQKNKLLFMESEMNLLLRYRLVM